LIITFFFFFKYFAEEFSSETAYSGQRGCPLMFDGEWRVESGGVVHLTDYFGNVLLQVGLVQQKHFLLLLIRRQELSHFLFVAFVQTQVLRP